MGDPTPPYTITRVYTASEWLADHTGTLLTFRDDIEAEATQHGHTINDITNMKITAHYTTDDGEPTPTKIQLEATWDSPNNPVVAPLPRADISS